MTAQTVPTLPTTGPSLSPSRAADFKTCPLLFRFRTIDKIPEQPTADQLRGTLVHAVLERLFDLPAAERTPIAAAGLVAPAWQSLLEEEPALASLFTTAAPATAPPTTVASSSAGASFASSPAATPSPAPPSTGTSSVAPPSVVTAPSPTAGAPFSADALAGAGPSATAPSPATPSGTADSAAGSAVAPSAAMLSAADPSLAAQPSAAGLSTTGLSAAGPSAAGPSAAGLSAAGRSVAASSAAGPSVAAPSAAVALAVSSSAAGVARPVDPAVLAAEADATGQQALIDVPAPDEAARLAAFLASATALLDGYFAVEDPQRLEPAEREALISTLVDDTLLIRGYIDRLDVSPAGDLRVVDYKTGGAPREAFEGRALFQLKFYALVLWRTRGVVPRVLRLLYLKDAEICDYSPDAEELERFERTLVALSEAIERAKRDQDFRPKPSRLCGWCSHQSLCPEFGGTPPPFPTERLVTIDLTPADDDRLG